MPTERTAEQAQVADAIARAKTSQTQWATKPYRERVGFVKDIYKKVAEHADKLADAISQDVNKPRTAALMGDIIMTLDNLKDMLKNGHKMLREETPSPMLSQFYLGSRKLKVSRQPYGVVGIIGPWNFPVYLNLDPICAALLAGNTVVWKPSEKTPLTNQVMKELFKNLPSGALVQLEGGKELGAALSKAPVDRIIFTGSTQTGRVISAQAANYTTPIATELSGKDACVIFKDANIEDAVKAVAWGMTNFAGQSAVKPQRIFIEQEIYETFKNQLISTLQQMKLGPANQAGTQIGPLINEKRVKYTERLIADAQNAGARVILGGHAVAEMHGNFFAPTLLEGVTPKMRIDATDVWAPVASLTPFGNEITMLKFINFHRLGLTASLWTKDMKRAESIARQLDVGVVMINNVVTAAGDARLPFGGRRLSGNMQRHGAWGIKEMTRPQSLSITSKGFFKPGFKSKIRLSENQMHAVIAFKAGMWKEFLRLVFKK